MCECRISPSRRGSAQRAPVPQPGSECVLGEECAEGLRHGLRGHPRAKVTEVCCEELGIGAHRRRNVADGCFELLPVIVVALTITVLAGGGAKGPPTSRGSDRSAVRFFRCPTLAPAVRSPSSATLTRASRP